MVIEKIDGVWAETGDINTGMTPAKKSAGFTGGEHGIIDDFNYVHNRSDKKVNEIIEDAPSGFEFDVPNTTIAKRFYPADDDSTWSMAFDDRNVISGGGTKAYTSLAVIFEADGTRKLLALDAGTSRQIDIYDIETMAADGNSGDLGGTNLPSGSGETWSAYRMCTDNSSVYVVYNDTNAAPITHQIQAYNISDWAVKTGWPATGTTLPGTGFLSNDYSGDVQIVSDTQIATTNPWNTITGSSSAAITIIDMSDGTIDGSGAGTASSDEAKHITSDGTNIYFTSTQNTHLHSCTIADPTVAGPAATITPDGDDYQPLCIGNVIVMSSDGGGTVEPIGLVKKDDGFPCFAATAVTSTCFSGGAMCFDGLCIWMRGQIQISSITGIQVPAVFRLSMSGMSSYDAAATMATREFETLLKSTHVIDNTEDYASAVSRRMAPIVLDGRDIFLVGDRAAGATLSGKIYRIPKALLR